MKGALTVITSTKPKTLGKCYKLREGKLEKTVSGDLVTGEFEVREFSNVEELSALLSSIRTDQAIMASLPVGRGAR